MALLPEDAKKLAALVPLLTVAVSLLTMVISGVWFASHISSSVEEHDRRITALEVSREQRWAVVTTALASIQAEMSGLKATVEGVRAAVDRIQNRDDRHDGHQ